MGANDYAASRMAQRAALASSVASSGDHRHQPAGTAPKRSPAFDRKPLMLDAGEREVAVHRACVLLESASEYYGMSAAELSEEKARIKSLPDDELQAVERTYAFVSQHVAVMVDDNKARECAIHSSPSVDKFFDKHGVSEEDLAVSKAPPARLRRR